MDEKNGADIKIDLPIDDSPKSFAFGGSKNVKDEKSEKSISNLIYGLIIAFVIVGIVVGVNVYSGFVVKEDSYERYNYSNGWSSFPVKKINDGLSTHYEIIVHFGKNPQPFKVMFRYGPLDVSDIYVPFSAKNRMLNDQEIFITIDPNANMSSKVTLAALELDKIIDNPYFFNIPMKAAVTSPYKNMLVKTCEDANTTSSVFWLKLGNETKVYTKRHCTIIQGTTEDEIMRAANRFAFVLLGIMRSDM